MFRPSFHRFQRIRANSNGLFRGGFSPDYSDVRGAFEDFTEIVSEFTGFWQGISHRFAVLEPVDEQHITVSKELNEIALLMGYSILRADYTRFKIDGDRYFKMGLSPFPFNEATLDVVREKQIKDRLEGIQSYFFMGNIKHNSKSLAKPAEVLAFIQKCTDLIKVIDAETPELSKGVAKYLLVYVSPLGFESGISSSMRTIAKNPAIEIKILDYRAMAELKRQTTPFKKLPLVNPSETELTKLWSQDIEELLRLRCVAEEVIHKKFEKNTTIMLADMKDFTKRTVKDSLESAQAVQTMSDILKETVSSYDGVGFNTEGDSFIATFDKTELAIIAALKSIEKIENYNQQLKEESRIYIHVGVCFGEVIFKNERPFVGTAVNMAARVMKEAEPNKVVIPEKTYKDICAFRNFDFVCLGSKELKGFEKQVTLYQVILKEVKPLF